MLRRPDARPWHSRRGPHLGSGSNNGTWTTLSRCVRFRHASEHHCRFPVTIRSHPRHLCPGRRYSMTCSSSSSAVCSYSASRFAFFADAVEAGGGDVLGCEEAAGSGVAGERAGARYYWRCWHNLAPTYGDWWADRLPERWRTAGTRNVSHQPGQLRPRHAITAPFTRWSTTPTRSSRPRRRSPRTSSAWTRQSD